jgi:hypothetical protein
VPSAKSGKHVHPISEREQAIYLVGPVICFVVLGSTIIHGLSPVAISLGGSISRKRGERAPLLGQETDGLDSMVHGVGGGESEPEVSGTDEE